MVWNNDAFAVKEYNFVKKKKVCTTGKNDKNWSLAAKLPWGHTQAPDEVWRWMQMSEQGFLYLITINAAKGEHKVNF